MDRGKRMRPKDKDPGTPKMGCFVDNEFGGNLKKSEGVAGRDKLPSPTCQGTWQLAKPRVAPCLFSATGLLFSCM